MCTDIYGTIARPHPSIVVTIASQGDTIFQVTQMTQRAGSSARTIAVQSSPYDDMPLSRILFRYLWPFWLLKNAATGDRYARAAAYRHNRSMRIYLPGYLVKWLCNCALALALTMALSSAPITASVASSATPGLQTLMAAGAAVMFACAISVLFVTGYIYVYLSRNDQ